MSVPASHSVSPIAEVLREGKPYKKRALVVDDDPTVREMLVRALEGWGFSVKAVAGGHEALEELHKSNYAVMLTDIAMPAMDGHELLRRAKAADSSLQVIMITGYGSIPSTVQAMRDGAFDYVTKPFELEEIRFRVERALEERGLRDENVRLREELRKGYDICAGAKLIGSSPAMQEIYETILAVSQNNANVLIEGPTGTGKELVAKAIHYSGPRAKARFLPVDCGSMSRTLLVSQLFGHLKGAFTGAVADNPGFFVAAEGGTLFLDEVTEMDPDLQVKLLRAIQEKEVTPVGATHPRAVDVRIVAATNRDVKEAMNEGRLRSDLYYRLGVVVIRISPLRERREDVVALAEYFNGRFAEEYGVAPKKVEPQALECLKQYAWPGNVRQLENVVEQAFALSRRPTITLDDLPGELRGGGETVAWVAEGIPTLAGSEKALVEHAMEEAGGNKSRAARMLGIDRKKLYRLLSRHGAG